MSPTSDTDDTDDEWCVGGQGFYSHGAKSLTHQHFVDQVVTAGGFNVHDVQGPEAAHKINMHLPSARVRHLSSNETQDAMLRYTCNHTLFEELKHILGLNTSRQIVKTKRSGVRLPLRIKHFSGSNPLLRLDNTTKNAFLGREVRVTVLEFMEMLCSTFGLPRGSNESYRRLKALNVTFAQNYVREDGLALFGNDSRRDIVSLMGLHDGNHLCCEIVCFVRFNNLRNVLNDVVVQQDLSSTYVFVRWLEPHPRAWERDVQRRPVCPGPLHINNCLWRYALTESPRASLINRAGLPSAYFQNQRKIFGNTPTYQNTCRTRELRAYYGLVTPASIVKIENMSQLFQSDTDSPNHMSWLQSVVMF